MATSKPLNLQTSHTANVQLPLPKTIKETYQKRSPIDHILLCPDTYIGSTMQHTKKLWLHENNQMVHRSISCVPDLYKIFDEIVVNAADNFSWDWW